MDCHAFRLVYCFCVYGTRITAILSCQCPWLPFGYSVRILLYLLTASNPFERILPAPLSGRDLNPLLQDFFIVIHPPFLYMGYVGFAVCFAIAIAALIERRFDSDWARMSRPWANAAWASLTIGIAL